MISSAKNELETVSRFEQEAAGDYTASIYARVYREYQETLQVNNANESCSQPPWPSTETCPFAPYCCR